MANGPRQRLIGGAITLVREHGVEGTGLTELLAHSNTARNSIYQHFPGGKAELIEASTLAAGKWISRFLVEATQEASPTEIITLVVDSVAAVMTSEEFQFGCPIVAAAAAGPDYPEVREAAATVFSWWRNDLTAALAGSGVPEEAAGTLASFAVSAVEGAIVQAMAVRSVDPLHDVATHLTELARAYTL